MSAVALLIGLLVVAYVGSQLMGARGRYGLASGVEYLLIGLVVGPHVLGLVEVSTLSSFDPLVAVGTAWLTLIIGVGYGVQGRRRVSVRGLVAGVILSLLTASTAALAVHLALGLVTPIRGRDSAIVSMGCGLAASETTRHAVRWVVGRNAAKGRLSELVADLAESDDLVPLLGLMAVFVVAAPHTLRVGAAWWTSPCATILLGVSLGGISTALLRGEPRASDGWGVLLGAALLATGLASRLGLSAQTTTFAMGISLAVLSRHKAELRTMFARSERAVLLPTLLLAGAHVRVEQVRDVAVAAGVALAVRVLVRFVAAPVLVALAGAPRSATSGVALGLLPSGALTITIGLVFAITFPGQAGDAVLAAAAAFTLAGELVGPPALGRALRAAGEVDPTGADADSPPSLPEPSA